MQIFSFFTTLKCFEVILFPFILFLVILPFFFHQLKVLEIHQHLPEAPY